MRKLKLWEVTYSWTEIGWPPSEGIECCGSLYLLASSSAEAKEKAKSYQEVKENSCTLEAKEYQVPELSLPEDKNNFGLELIIKKLK